MADNSKIIQACHKAFTGWEKNDLTKIMDLFAEDGVFEFPTSLPYGGRYEGAKEFRAFWADLFEYYYEYFIYDLHTVLDAGTHIVVPVIARAKTKTGRTFENEHCFLFKVEGGKIVYGRIYADTAKGIPALEGMKKHPPRATGVSSSSMTRSALR